MKQKYIHMPFELPGISRTIPYSYTELCTRKYVTWIFIAALFAIAKYGQLLKYPSKATQWNIKKSVKGRQLYVYKYGMI